MKTLMKTPMKTLVNFLIKTPIKIILTLVLTSTIIATSHAALTPRVEPANWWVGYKHQQLQVMIYDENIGNYEASVNHAGVKLSKVERTDNPNYLFVYLHIAETAKLGKVKLQFFKDTKPKKPKNRKTHIIELHQKNPSPQHARGFSTSDNIYLITPDRFANGNPNNDATQHTTEKPNRASPLGRHGGDIQGIIQHLDYIKAMGFTAIWLNPILINDMPDLSYHGYAVTDMYQVDPRYGTFKLYQQLVSQAKSQGIGVIMDIIVNHIGTEHWWLDDLPASDWLNPSGTITNHIHAVSVDPYASQVDIDGFHNGWFVDVMADLNQTNQLMADYLIQNSIWWIESLGLAGIRMDTYSYSDKYFMSEWARRIMLEYPNFNIVGEEWHSSPAIVSYFQKGKVNADGYVSHLPSLMDFPLMQEMRKNLTVPEASYWDSGFLKMYEMLSHDMLYSDPNKLVVFPDNHDMDRIFTAVNQDYGLFKIALAYVLTIRGTPQLYYGTEILMHNSDAKGDHGVIRTDFPGGWKGDSINAVTGEGLTNQQRQAQHYVKKLLHWRQQQTAIHSGALEHYIPKDGIYVYFRYNAEQTIMVALNKNAEPTELKLERFNQRINNSTEAYDVIAEQTLALKPSIMLPANSPLILQLNHPPH